MVKTTARTLFGSLLTGMLLCCWMAGCHSQRASGAEPGASLRVLSFNIRYGTAKDGQNRWELRRGQLLQSLREFRADLVGLQEALDFQVQEISEALPRYQVIGIGRDQGGGGEQCTLLLDRERFRVLRSGTFWLSPEPEREASKGWDAALPRICTWAELEDRHSGQRLAWLNTHFDHRGKRAREESARLIHRRAREFEGLPVIVTGDLNAGEDSQVLAYLKGGWLRDSYRVHQPEGAPAGTFNGFQDRSSGPKIDYVLVCPRWDVQRAWIDRPRLAGRPPSDHEPVLADLLPLPD